MYILWQQAYLLPLIIQINDCVLHLVAVFIVPQNHFVLLLPCSFFLVTSHLHWNSVNLVFWRQMKAGFDATMKKPAFTGKSLLIAKSKTNIFVLLLICRCQVVAIPKTIIIFFAGEGIVQNRNMKWLHFSFLCSIFSYRRWHTSSKLSCTLGTRNKTLTIVC